MVSKLLDLIRRTSCVLPDDVRAALARAKGVEALPRACQIFEMIQTNVALAEHQNVPICQDTGTLTFFWEIPWGVSTHPLMVACREAVKQATKLGYLRQNTIDALSGVSVETNVSGDFPVMHFEQGDYSELQVTLLLKGGGSENMSCQFSLPDSKIGAGRDLAGVRACVLNALTRIQGQGCAPGILGICIGADRAGGYATAKKQFLRKLDDHSPIPELAALEESLLAEANELGIGPMGTGGQTTLLGVKIAAMSRLPASYFVTIAYLCWACRRQSLRLSVDEARMCESKDV